MTVQAEPGQGFIRDAFHVFPVRVYYEDTDVGGIVYYANYLKFAERARSEMLRCLGCPHADLQTGEAVAIAVRRCEVDYFAPARFDDILEVRTGNVDMEAASLWLDQTIWRGEAEIARLRVRLACLKRDGRPARIPEVLRKALRPVATEAQRSAPILTNSPATMARHANSGGEGAGAKGKKEEEQV